MESQGNICTTVKSYHIMSCHVMSYHIYIYDICMYVCMHVVYIYFTDVRCRDIQGAEKKNTGKHLKLIVHACHACL